MSSYKYIFGPIPSRRLGISLGVDLVKHKVCSLDCVYCEAGKTTCLTTERKEYIPTQEILDELINFLSNNPKIDYITFSGAGEPTLNSGLGHIAKEIKRLFPQYKLSLITNGTLFDDPQVRKEVLCIDCILPSLDAVSKKVFDKINRPSPMLDNDKIISGLKQLRIEYPGKILLEIFLIPGINTHDEELAKLKEALYDIKPDIVQLNTIDRPGTEDWVERPDFQLIEHAKKFFEPFNVEIIAKFEKKPIETGYTLDTEYAIIEYLKRRPATMQDLTAGLSKHVNEISKYISHLLDTEVIEKRPQKSKIYYVIKQ